MKKYNLAGGWELFECERRRNHDQCPGKIKVRGDQVEVLNQVELLNHNHKSDPARNKVLKVSAAIKPSAQATLDG